MKRRGRVVVAVAGPVVGQDALLGGRLDVAEPWARRRPSASRTPSPSARAIAPSSTLRAGARVAAGEVDQVLERVVGEADAAARAERAGQAPLGVVDRPPDDGPDVVVGQRLEAPDPQPRQEGAVHLEVRVLGRRPDQGDRAVLDVGQEARPAGTC